MYRLFLSLTLFVLAGCQIDPYTHAPTPGKTDWYQAGFEDALSGAEKKDSATLSANFNDLKPDSAAYMKGYASGQQKMCHADFLYAWGVNGKIFPASCDGVENATQLRESWQKGMDQGARDALLNG